ncbi:MAG: UDP-N-acetylglucosamine--N-acetylmuramyl-(pentapeptide) pyrophosphoryl-undecaprenol N-acetylglucosamine transferase [bacterium]|nr:UDP-N-acetylglucosamine--N-acetylmuramyl-(pentapeptide) pyrophosphoryl-undecaprenol N-acetylglucosamine transferase [bacterium]
MRNILIAAGGSGGHLYPALAIAEVFIEKGFQVYLFTSKKRPANIRSNSINLLEGYSIGWDRSFKGIFRTFWSLLRDIVLSTRILLRLKPMLVLGMGGYTSISPILIAFIFGIPRAVHEQNIIPGLANKLLAPFVNRIFASFPDTNFGIFQRKVVYTGLPLRKEFYNIIPSKHDKFTVLVMGGSQGARVINNTVLEMVENNLLKDVRIIHITGIKEYDRLKERIARVSSPDYEVYGYKEDIWTLYERVDLVISRSGAGTVIELATVNLPAILIPYKGAEGHQYLNAQWLAKRNKCLIVDQDKLSPKTLAEGILKFKDGINTRNVLDYSESSSLPDASYRVVEESLEIIGGHYGGNKHRG